ncbi:MAG TPA: DUF1302 family protein [Steroidobacteraceae bacterium]|nr:DUF1302 family protein [Steroidobacteraceae bacterium]
MKTTVGLVACTVAALGMTPVARAQEVAEEAAQESSSAFDVSFSGMIRSETAFSTGEANPLNQRGNVYNGKTVARDSSAIGFFSDTTTRNGQPDDPDINMQLFRAQLDGNFKFSEHWQAVAKVHALFDPGWYHEYDPGDVGSSAAGELYGKPNYFDYVAEGKSRSTPLEWTGENYQVYFPALFLEYNRGPLDVRIGNQQIAWGQAIFFRVLDVPNGLDLRRHSLLDYVPEEFSDKRVPTLALRTTYQFANQWMADAYVSQFRPSVVPNPNHPYNAIASQFTIHDRYDDYDDRLDFGIRLKGQAGNFGLQGVVARRYNPDGVYRWTASGVNRDIPGMPGSGTVLANTPFEVDSSGVWSAEEWFDYAARSRLDGVAGLNSAVRDFQPWTGLLNAFEAPSYELARQELDLFFQLAGGIAVGQNNGGLRGHLERVYDLETNVGAGVSYVFSGEPGSLTDQLIVNLEAMYTPDRVFTDPGLGKDFVTEDELVAALVLEKYQRFSENLPATYMVAQVLHKTESDLFGRHLDGYGATVNHVPTGESGYTAVALAFQQPFENLIWRADLAVLYDMGGGLLVQPALRWKPNGTLTIEAFYNYLNGTIGGNPNDNALSTVDYADEFALRVGLQF